MRRLRDRLESRILADTPGSRVIGSQAARLPNTSAIGFEGVSGEALAIRLDLEGIAVSVGSACSSGTISPSPALLSLGFTPEEAKRVVRISLSRFTTEEEVEIAAERIPAAVREMRRAGAVPDSGVPDVLTTR
jgi:cysteine desulfurase